MYLFWIWKVSFTNFVSLVSNNCGFNSFSTTGVLAIDSKPLYKVSQFPSFFFDEKDLPPLKLLVVDFVSFSWKGLKLDSVLKGLKLGSTSILGVLMGLSL